MPRVKRGVTVRRKHKKILGLAKGYRGSRRSRIRTAIHVVRRALVFSYRDRRVRAREFRRLWITRINAAARSHGLTYSQFMHGISKLGIDLDRSALSNMAIMDPSGFQAIVGKVKASLPAS